MAVLQSKVNIFISFLGLTSLSESATVRLSHSKVVVNSISQCRIF